MGRSSLVHRLSLAHPWAEVSRPTESFPLVEASVRCLFPNSSSWSPPAAVVRAGMAASDLPPFFARAYGAVAAAAAGQGLEVAGEPFAFCPNTPTEVVEVAAGFPVSGAVQPAGDVVPMELPGGRAVTTVRVGPYDTCTRPLRRCVSGWPRKDSPRPITCGRSTSQTRARNQIPRAGVRESSSQSRTEAPSSSR